MALTTKTLLPLTTYGVPSGNYNGTTPDFIGDTVPAASYYTVKSGSMQTAVITATNFVGVITLQATLGTIAEQTVWFDVATYGSATTPTSGTTPVNLVGNFVWVRAVVTEFTSGTINSAILLF
jgi:hypothetical protein